MPAITHLKKTLNMSLILSLFFTPICSYAAVVEISPMDDTYVDAFRPADNFGASMELNVGLLHGSDDYRCRTFLLFDLSALPANAAIVSATLKMEAAAHTSDSPDTNVAVHNVDDHTWNELDLVWQEPPNDPPIFHPTPADVIAISAPGFYYWDVTFGAQVAFGIGNTYSAVVKLPDDKWDPAKNNFIQFHSRHTGMSPKLIINYSTPTIEPLETPLLVGVVSIISWEDNYIYVKADPDPYPLDSNMCLEDISTEGAFTLYIEDTPPELVVIDPNSLIVHNLISYDNLDRVIHAWSRPRGSGALPPAEIDFTYDILGNLASANLDYPDGSNLFGILGADQNDNFFKSIFEKKNNSSGSPIYSASVNYFLHNSEGLLDQSISGCSGAVSTYSYDSLNRLVSVAANGAPAHEYQYHTKGLLQMYTNYENRDYGCTYNYSYDPLNRLAYAASQTNTPDPDHVRLGRLVLSYNDNDILREVGYSSDESLTAPLQTIYYTNYTYDGLDRRIRAQYISPNPDVPTVTVTIDPDLPEPEHTVTQYIYDRRGRLAWTVETNGYVTRTIYNQTAGLEEKAMLKISMEEPNETLLTTYEYDNPATPHRSTDLQGNFTQYEYDSCGKLMNSYVLGTHGGGGSGGGAYGPLYQSHAYALLDSSTTNFWRFTWDQFGNLGFVIEEGDVDTAGGEEYGPLAKKKKTKKKIAKNSKITKKKFAKEHRKGCTESVEGDCNGDCKVNLLDLACLAQNWLLDKTY